MPDAEKLAFSGQLQIAIDAGRHTLIIDYRGPITTGSEGFFAMDYDS